MVDLIFKKDPNLTRTIILYNSFGPPDALPTAAIRNPSIFGKSFYEAARLNSEIKALPQGYNTLFAYLFGEGSKAEDSKSSKLVAKLDRLVHAPVEDVEYLYKAQQKIEEIWKHKEKSVKKEVKRVFGFNLPAKTYVVLNRSFCESGSSGSGLYSGKNMVAISLEIAYNNDSEEYLSRLVGVILHEVLHGLASKHNLIDRRRDKEYFEEALLDYFVPYGIIARNLKIIKARKPEDFNQHNVNNRSYSKKMSDKLLPVIEEYDHLKRDQTIWDFLKQKGFDEYLMT